MRVIKFFTSLVLVVTLFSQVAFAVEQGPFIYFFETKDMSLTQGELNMRLSSRKSENLIIDNNILSIGVKGEYVYFGTHTGVSRLNTRTMQFHHHLLETQNMSTVIAIGDSEFGTVWVGRAGGISKIRNEGIEKLSGTSFKNIFVYDGFTDEEGNVWLATSQNLHKFDTRDNWRSYRFEREHIPTTLITTFFIDSKGGMWLGGDAIYHLEAGKTIKYMNWNIHAPADSPRLRINDITELGGWVYVATDRGVFRRGLETNQWEHFAGAADLPAEYVTSLAVTDDNTLWIGTINGLVSYKADVLFTYTTENGLVHNHVNTLIADGSAIWVGTSGGAARLKGNAWVTVTRDGVVDRDFTLTKEQADLQASIEKQAQLQAEKEEKRREAEIWEARKGVFEDLKNIETWAAEYVFELYESGVLTKNENFYPLRNVTREELAKMLSIVAGFKPDQYEKKLAPYIDVPEQHWANKYIYALVENGVLERGKVFGLGEEMTRLEAIQWILKAFNVRLSQYDEAKFPDVSESDRAWVETADTNGIVKGYSKETSSMVMAREIYTLPRFLQPGSSGEDVKSLQKILQATGFYPENREITGFYDGTTTDAVADYQVTRGILSKFTGGQFTPGLGAAGGDTRSRMITEMVPTGETDSVSCFFDPAGKLTRAQMAKVLSIARGLFGK